MKQLGGALIGFVLTGSAVAAACSAVCPDKTCIEDRVCELLHAKVCFRSEPMNKRRSSIFAVLGFSLIAYSSSVRAEQEFTDLVAKVMPSVVNIAIEAMGQRVKLEQSG